MAEKIFIKAKSIKEINELKYQYGEKAKVIAGGTDVMVKVNTLIESPECFLYIGEAGLNYIKEENNNIIIGSATTLSNIGASEIIIKKLPILATVISQMASLAIRNTATIGGNLCNASPAADTAIPLLTLNSKAVIISKIRQRTIEMSEFFKGPGKTVLSDKEILKEIIIPCDENLKVVYKKLGRRKAESLSVVSVCVAVIIEKDICKEARIALGAVASTPVLAVKNAALLIGKKINKDIIEKVAEQINSEISPISDQRSTEWYRRRASKVLVKNLLEEIVL